MAIGAVFGAEVSDRGKIFGREFLPCARLVQFSRRAAFSLLGGGGDRRGSQTGPAERRESDDGHCRGASGHAHGASSIDEGNQEEQQDSEVRKNDRADDFKRAFEKLQGLEKE